MIFSFFKQKKSTLTILFILATSLLLMGCDDVSDYEKSWNMIEKSGENTIVNMYLIENPRVEVIDFWINHTLKNALSKTKNIELHSKIVPMEEVITLFEEYKERQEKTGVVDLIVVDEESLEKLQNTDFLYENYAAKIKNVNANIDLDDLDIRFAEHHSLNYSAVPFNKETLLFCYNDDIIYDFPANYQDFKELLENKKGIFTYPDIRLELGYKFVKNVILSFTNSKEFAMDLSQQEVEELVRPAMNYLKSIEPYLYQSGRYVNNIDDYNDFYAKANVAISMTDNLRFFDEMVGEAIYPENTIAFTLGMNAGKNDYFVIPENSTNKAGAMIVINEALDSQKQSSKYGNSKSIGITPYSFERLSKSQLDAMNKVMKRRTFARHSELMSKKAHDIPNRYKSQIIEIWKRNFIKDEMKMTENK